MLASCVLVTVLVAAPASARAAGEANGQRALDSYVALRRYFFDAGSRRYRERIGATPTLRAWPISQVMASALALARVPGAPNVSADVNASLTMLTRLRRGPLYSAWSGGDVYYDDNAWIAQIFLDTDALNGTDVLAHRSATIFGAIVHAWDVDPSHTCAGGIYWTKTPHVFDRNTVSTVNGALVGLRLYELTHRQVFLYWARRMLEWTDQCMLGPAGLYFDHIRADATIDQSLWSYNQGSLIGALVELYRSTGDAAMLSRAETITDAALAYYQGQRLQSEPPEFAAIFFRYVLELAALDQRSTYIAAAQSYADQAWTTRRNPITGLFSSRGHTRLLDQAAFVQIYAALARSESLSPP